MRWPQANNARKRLSCLDHHKRSLEYVIRLVCSLAVEKDSLASKLLPAYGSSEVYVCNLKTTSG